MSTTFRGSKSIFATTLFLFALAMPAFGQFNSGSTGSDGALAFPNAKPGDVIVFDPKSFSPPLDPAHDNIFNFTTITIPAGVTIKLVSNNLAAGPVVWLATGAADLEGTLDLSGSNGHLRENPPIQSLRTPAAPGPGGYAGGVGGNGSSFTVEPGLGPGGGAAGTSQCGGGGAFTGNSFLVPLFGGSGGGGENLQGFGGGGGGGGGAILIASSVSITVNGTISANGGSAPSSGGGGGSGGAIRLVAPLIQGSGHLSAVGGTSGCGGPPFIGGGGTVRLEAFQEGFSGNFPGANVTAGSPFNTFVPTAPPTLTVTSLGGVAVNPLPTGSFQVPDVTINSSGPVTVAISASNVPVNTVVKLEFYSENGPDIFTQSTPLAGSLASSTASAQVTLPSGFTRGFVFASFQSQ